MADTPEHYDGFISYRHLGRSPEIANYLQQLLEAYRSPFSGRYVPKGRRIQRIFTDTSEMPLSDDLGKTIWDALDQSRFLIVLATPEYIQSKWCLAELSYFLDRHQGSGENILFLLVSGTPEESILAPLKRCGATGFSGELPHEPLFADITAKTAAQARRKLRKEFLRLAAPIIGCGYDDLVQRHRRRRIRNGIIAAACCAALAAAGGFGWRSYAEMEDSNTQMQENMVVLEQERDSIADNRDIDNRLSAIRMELTAENKRTALKSIHELCCSYGSIPEYAEKIRRELSPLWVRANYCAAFTQIQSVESTNLSLTLSTDGTHLIGWSNRRDTGLSVSVYDLYLNPVTECTLDISFSGWNFSEYSLDFKEETGRILFTTPEGRHSFHLDGSYISTAPPEPGAATDTSSFSPGDNIGPWLETEDSTLYFLTNLDDPFAGYDPFGEAILWKYPKGASEPEAIALLDEPKELFNYNDLALTPDGRFLLVTSVRGIYEARIDVIDLNANQFEACWSFTIDRGIQPYDLFFDVYDTLGLILVRSASGVTALGIPADGQQAIYAVFSACEPGSIQLTKEGLCYVADYEGRIYMTSCQDLSLVDALTGAGSGPAQLDPADNVLCKDYDSISRTDISYSHEDLVITGTVFQHQIGPNVFSGGTIGLEISDSCGDVLLRMAAWDVDSYAYFSPEDCIFGFVKPISGKAVKALRLYDFSEFTNQLHTAFSSVP